MSFKTCKAPEINKIKIFVKIMDMVDEQNFGKIKMLYYKYIYDKRLIHFGNYNLIMAFVVNRDILNHF